MCERTIAEYEEELCPTKEEKERQHEKHQVVLHTTDIHQLIGHQEECLPHLQGDSFTLEDTQPSHFKGDEEDPHSPYCKEEEEGEFPVGQEEADVSKFPLTVVSVKTEEHEDKAPESSQLHHSPNVCEEHLHPEQQKWSFTMEPQPSHIKKEEEHPLIPHFKEEEEDPLTAHFKEKAMDPLSPHVKEEEEDPLTPHIKDEDEDPLSPHIKEEEEDPLSPHIKEEEEEHSISQQGEHVEGLEEVDVTKMPVTGVPVKSEDDEVKGEREAEPPSSSSTQHMTTEADGDHCGGSQADKLLAPLSDSEDTTSHSPDTDDEHSKDDATCHTDNTHFTCSHCDKTFKYHCRLLRHKRTHTGEKPFSCSICSKGFTLKHNFKVHMRIHTGEKPFSCSECGKSFVMNRSLKVHMTTHTGEKPFSCSICGKDYTQKHNFKAHMRTHTGEKPFTCSICGKDYAQRDRFKAHMRIHTGEKPFSCSECGKSYVINRSLKVHMRKHTGEKVLSCSVCGERFSSKYQCKKHKCAGENSSSK
ncbi:uncharacterized protein [Nerophis lumbriciformis]|uniref:uncharacterized protein isoform X2 n=2 Tax=Nerophis lumbriciformis TaxID=546530 RepID=UPI002AE01954|nr:oocyte zinc finger protein XlCOF22-like isoform X2 [Nerophis lumbriciformis]